MTEETLFAAALERADPADRSAFLDAHCPDPAVRRRVEELVAAHVAAGSFLNHPAVGADVTTDLRPDDPGATRTQAPTDPDATADPRAGAADPDEALAFLKPPTRPGSLGRLAHYEVLEVLGSGGFGTVLKAFDDRLHRVVAVKVLAPQLAASGAARARFLREARTAAAVRDEHVVNVFAVSDDDAPVPFLVMELVAGQTLQGKLDKAGPLPPKEVLRIGSQVARGLAAAHKQGLIHRDIKPANILLENGVERVKVTDFGLARAADDASLSQSGVVAGTPMYMSPEQARGDALDTRSDLFSLGSVLYALCTGRPPFRAETTLAVLKRVVEDDPRPVRDVNPEVPRWLADVVAKLHAKAPAERFQTAQEVAELMSGYLADLQQQGTVVARAGVAPRRRKPVPARTGWGWWFAAALTVAALLTAGGVFGESEPPVPRREVHYDFVTVFAVFGLAVLAPAAALMTFSRRWGARGLGVAGAALFAAAANGTLGLLAPPDNRGEVIVVPAVGLEQVLPHRDGAAVGDWVDASNGTTLRLPPGHYTLLARFAPGVTAAAWEVTGTQPAPFGTLGIEGRVPGPVAEFSLVAGGRVTVRAEVAKTRPPSAAPPPASAPFTPEQAKAHQEAWAKHLGVPVEFAHPSGLTFRLVPPGEYGMGFTDIELAAVRSSLRTLPDVGDYQWFAAESSGPRHTVRITRPFYLAKYETTAGQFRRFVEAATHTPTGTIDWTGFVTPGQEDRQPVVGVSWADADAFCRRLGPGYELPSEAQWEYAARGGGAGLWSFGNDPTKLLDHAVFGQAWPKPGPVGQKAPNPFGLYDVHGGADEWCRDWHVRDFYRRSPIDDPVNLEDPTDPNTGRVSRGGSWNARAVYSEVAFRAFDHPTRPNLPKGFRVALTGDLKAAVDAAARGPAEPPTPLAQARRDLVATKEKELAVVKARFDAGILTRRELAEAEIGVFEARLDGALPPDAVRLLGLIVDRHETRRAVAAARVEAGILVPADLHPIDADLARAKARLAEVRVPVPQRAADVLPFWVGTWRTASEVVVPQWAAGQGRGGGPLVLDLVGDGKYLRGVGTEDGRPFQTLLVQTYDESKQALRGWFYTSDGKASGPGPGLWDADARTLLWTEKLPDGIQAVHRFEFVDADTVRSRLLHQNDKNEIVFDLRNTFTRQKAAAVPRDLAAPAARPPELAVLDRLVGEWRNDTTLKALAPGAKDRTVVTTEQGRAILGGRFVEVTHTGGLAGTNDYWLAGYDPAAKRYRTWFFGADGGTAEFAGTWDAAAATMRLATADGSAAGSWVFAGADRRDGRFTIRDADGAVVAELTSVSRRFVPGGKD